jgi:putative peptidoglycan lipid II flippase
MAFLGIILGFANQLVIAYFFGATLERDAYFAAAIVPAYLSTLFVGSIGSIFMGSYVRQQSRNSPAALQEFVSRTLNVCGLAAILITVAGMIFARQGIAVGAPGFPDEQSRLTADILRILFPSIMFMVLTALLTTMHQAENRFLLPSLAPLVSIAISATAVLLWGRTAGIISLAYGSLAGSVFAFLLLVPIMWRYGGHRFLLTPDAEVVRMLAIAAPLLLTGIINRSTGVFERMIASGLDPGSVSYLGYANQFLNSLSGIAVSGISTTIFPLMSRFWEAGDLDSLRHYFAKGVRFILFVTLPVVAIVVVMGDAIIRVMLERGAFGPQATHGVSASLSMMMGAFVALSCGSIIAKGFYLTGKTRVFSVIVTTEVVIYLAVGYLLTRPLSYLGLAAALSVSAMYTGVIGVIVLRKVFGGLDLRGLVLDVLRCGAASAVTGVLVYILQGMTPWRLPEAISTVLIGSIGLAVYVLLVTTVFAVEDVVHMRERFLSRVRASLKGRSRSEDDQPGGRGGRDRIQ